MDSVVTIGDRLVGPGAPTYVIAEIGINHGGEVGTARQLVQEAARCGADAVKLQTYDTDKRVPADSPIYDVLKRAELDRSAHLELVAVARDVGVHLISTPFDDAAVDLLADLAVPAYKIASFDIVNLNLIDRVARHKQPVIVSRGMASLDESTTAVELLRRHGAPIILLHAVSAYPLEPFDANLAIMDTLREQYRVPVGWSDHTLDIDVAALAVARGADVVEKHFTLDRSAEGPDHALSADRDQFASLVRRIREVERIVGSAEPRLLDAEAGTVSYRRRTDAA